MKTEKAWWANIYVGTYDKEDGQLITPKKILWICQDYCNDTGFCVTVTPTEFVYTKGFEPGAIVGCIQYPRFPQPIEELRNRALDLAEKLRVEMNQCRVTVMMPDEVVMLSKKGYENT